MTAKAILGLSAAIFAGAAPVVAQDRLSSSARGTLFENQTRILDERAAAQYNNSVRLQPPVAVVPGRFGLPEYEGSYAGPYLAVAKDAARRHRIPEGLFLRLVQQESGWNAGARSVKGAMGLAQLMPATARYLGVDADNPAENLDGGACYLAEQYRDFGSWTLALAA